MPLLDPTAIYHLILAVVYNAAYQSICSYVQSVCVQGPLSSSFPIENRIITVSPKALKTHLDHTKHLPFVKRISDFHLLLLLARYLDVNADIPALGECVQKQLPVPDGYQFLIESLAAAAAA